MYYAIENRNYDTAKKLLVKGVDINTKNSDKTPLSRAITNSDLNFLILLFNHDISANIEIQNGYNTHLSSAIQRDRVYKNGQTWEVVKDYFLKGELL
ncbi:ankyrin repeat domain-containing protein [Wolbachia endosymbiont of Brugia malayi]|uniref:ankyrin repeat domain-containing protein n=1 Tax=Wolbachia endosymbiont of Brugia malayi TaxID=80849 RepID=UPI0005A24176|nr:ankyrin repeat domain-containing protein [Wolbachia endosymbiont of Brugia malayi]